MKVRYQAAKKHRFKILKTSITVLLAVLLLWRVVIPVVQYAQRQFLPVPKLSQESKPSVSSRGLKSRNAILIRKSDGQILMDKNADQKIYPASMTKIMTVIIALQKLPFPDERITLTSDIFNQMEGADASMAGFCPGEWVRSST